VQVQRLKNGYYIKVKISQLSNPYSCNIRSAYEAWAEHVPAYVHLISFACLLAGTPTCIGFSDNCKSFRKESATYKQAVREVDSDVQPMTFWFSNGERFPNPFDLNVTGRPL